MANDIIKYSRSKKQKNKIVRYYIGVVVIVIIAVVLYQFVYLPYQNRENAEGRCQLFGGGRYYIPSLTGSTQDPKLYETFDDCVKGNSR